MTYEMAGPALVRMDIPAMWDVNARYRELAEGLNGMEPSAPFGYGQSQSVAIQRTDKIRNGIKECATLIDEMNVNIVASVLESEAIDLDNGSRFGSLKGRIKKGGDKARCYREYLVSRPR